jgi:hypothetical protein
MTEPAASADASPAKRDDADGGEIIARAAREFRLKRYAMVVLLVGAGLYFAYDGYQGYPSHNRRVADVQRRLDEAEQAKDEAAASTLRVELSKMREPHSDSDIRLQRQLGWALPPLGLALLARSLYQSRGRYRLAGQTLEVPGHPPVAMSQITRLDDSQWDRKRVAKVEYDLGNGRTGRLKLDDWIYQQEPTVQIFERIRDAMKGRA